MPLPKVSEDTVNSTIRSLREGGCKLTESFVQEQPALADIIAKLMHRSIHKGKTNAECFLVGTMIMYRMLKRQVEADDMNLT